MKQSPKQSNPIDVEVGRRIRLQRKIRGMSQQVQKYEKGTNRVGASRLNQIAAALGVLFPISSTRMVLARQA